MLLAITYGAPIAPAMGYAPTLSNATLAILPPTCSRRDFVSPGTDAASIRFITQPPVDSTQPTATVSPTSISPESPHALFAIGLAKIAQGPPTPIAGTATSEQKKVEDSA